MDIKIQIQSTPNPNALKFVLNTPVKTEGKASYKSAEESQNNPIANSLFGVPHVSEVYFFDNYITVTQDGAGDWDELEDKIQTIILAEISEHDPNFQQEVPKAQEQAPAADSPEINQINSILDQTIRPALQMDGGDLMIIGLNDNVLTVHYQGACGSCPSAAMGTLKAIEQILRDEYNPNVVVEAA